ncbi:DUF697 domain-containing protein [Papillibacter cinnamivorans]|uniref:TIGR01620 family protein n=1 Tax=Papillibacter cinnamivorans DSM 12816 TaxID=1122930 RepID=A0A1W2CL49_9FIRM|nr:DUF697 domain-containing protein [Papillibacter cinnamivorans]SMC85714.1 protein of unknown function [Papillibacter cinnamivorans DSM 12816]
MSKKIDTAEDTAGLFDKKPYISLLTAVAAILLISFAIIMINQAAQLVSLAMSVHSVFGKALFIFFLLLALTAVLGTLLILLKLDKPLAIPDETDQAAYSLYLSQLKKRLMKNKYLKSQNYVWDGAKSDLESVDEALGQLDRKSQSIIKKYSSAVFITTAVSQNGSLDGVFVFITIIKLIWQVSMLYRQRPAVRELIKLYSNVFATALLARQIDDIDIMAEQLEPVLSAFLGGTVGNMVPGVSYIGSFVADCILEGGLNTLLTLRVGLIAQKYCRSMVKAEPKTLGKTATVQACAMLGDIVLENSKRITNALLKAMRNATISPFVKGKNKISEAFEKKFSERAKPSV